MIKNREEQITVFTRKLMEGGWSSVYAFVNDHIEDWELEDDEEQNEEHD